MTLKTHRRQRTWLMIVLGALTCTQIGFMLAQQPLPSAYAQSYTEDDVTNYARAVAGIEPRRQEAYGAANDILASANGGELSILDAPLKCTATRMSDMPDVPRASRVDLRTVLVDFCNDASAIAEENDLTAKRFNDITQAHRQDPELAARIQAAIAAL
ncbi:MAG: DUF4168 domain-containing protein [Phormidesmis sp.]